MLIKLINSSVGHVCRVLFLFLPSPPPRWKLFHRVVKHSKLVFFCSLASIKKNWLLMFKVTVVHHLFSSQLVHFFYISSLKKFKTTRWTFASQPADLSVWKRPCCSFAALLFCFCICFCFCFCVAWKTIVGVRVIIFSMFFLPLLVGLMMTDLHRLG